MAHAELTDEVEQLRQSLLAHAQAYRVDSTKFDELEQLWNSTLQPQAHALAERMLSYVPSDDPRVQIEYQHGPERRLKSSDLIGIDAPITRENAAIHLEAAAKSLAALALYLPHPIGDVDACEAEAKEN
jgi:hypothetical protein